MDEIASRITATPRPLLALKTADGRRICGPEPAEEGPPVVELTLTDGGHGCCGPRIAGFEGLATGPLWERQTHFRIVEIAVDRMRRMKVQTPEAKKIVDLWDLPGFPKQVEAGLRDADEKEPWTCLGTFAGHFYSPVTRRNYFRDDIFPTAVKWGAEHFAEAVRLCRSGQPIESGYHLGLSLHFLTDLTQPMHSANFVNCFGEQIPPASERHPFWEDFRHQAFESLAEKRVSEGFFDGFQPFFEPRDVWLGDIENAEWFLHETARNSRAVWDNGLREAAARVPGNEWNANVVEGFLERSLRLAPKAAGRYMAYWAAKVASPVT